MKILQGKHKKDLSKLTKDKKKEKKLPQDSEHDIEEVYDEPADPYLKTRLNHEKI
ncbi:MULTISPECIES: hypothetical protein [Bacillaceae]|uniref:hypothetical protein n=1 Tax=Bacillaceae TaxID=186817 RepID=UPI000B2ECADE|nr:hypothetical protein [Bacillus sp. FJAT-27916]